MSLIDIRKPSLTGKHRRRRTASAFMPGMPSWAAAAEQRTPRGLQVLGAAAERCYETRMQRVIRAVFEKGMLKPLERVRLGEQKVCLVSIYPEDEWNKDFEALLARMRRKARRHAPADIEDDITAARAEVKARRRETRRSA